MPSDRDERAPAGSIDGNEIWEALFSITKGFVPEGMTEEVCQSLADWINAIAARGIQP